jgi:hypothetical protein
MVHETHREITEIILLEYQYYIPQMSIINTEYYYNKIIKIWVLKLRQNFITCFGMYGQRGITRKHYLPKNCEKMSFLRNCLYNLQDCWYNFKGTNNTLKRDSCHRMNILGNRIAIFINPFWCLYKLTIHLILVLPLLKINQALIL